MIAIEPGAIPPSSAIPVEALATIVGAFEVARDQAKASDRELVKLERGNARALAEAQDAVELADSLEAGRAAPKPKHLAEHEARLQAVRREASARALVAERCWRVTVEAFGRYEDELRQSCEAEIEERRAAFLATIDKCEEAHNELLRALPWRQFLAANGDVMGAGVYRAAAATSTLAPRRHQLDPEKVLTSDLFAVLRGVGGPEPPREGLNPQVARAAEEGVDYSGQLPPQHWPLAAQGVRGRVAPDSGPSTWPMPRVPG
jgi:hypothetical protein